MSIDQKPKRRQSASQLANLSLQELCGGTRNDGEPCEGQGSIQTDQGPRCPHHSGKYSPEQKSEWGSRGGLTSNHHKTMQRLQAMQTQTGLEIPDLHDAKSLEAFLAKIIAETRAGLLPPSVARVLNEMVGMRLKLAELELQKELSDLQARLDEETT